MSLSKTGRSCWPAILPGPSPRRPQKGQKTKRSSVGQIIEVLKRAAALLAVAEVNRLEDRAPTGARQAPDDEPVICCVRFRTLMTRCGH